MNKLLLAAAGLATIAALAVLLPPGVGSAQSPAGKGEAITVPTAPTGTGQPIQSNSAEALFRPTQPAGTDRQYLPTAPGLPNVQPPVQAPEGEEQPHVLREYLSQNLDCVEINNDIAVQPSDGNFLICLNWYSGPDAPKAARDLALELRGPDFKLKAFVFTKGIEERKAELQKIIEYVEKQKRELAKVGLENDSHIRVPVTRYEIQCAVLVGGYKDMESAHRALEQLKNYSAEKHLAEKLKDKNIPLHAVGKMQFDDKGKCIAAMGLVDPFTHALAVSNPSIKMPEQGKGLTKEDLALLRTLNENEPYSLLKCPKSYTIAVRKFSTPACIDSKQSSSSMLEKLGLGSSGNKVDGAAESAHNLAKILNGSNSLQREKLTAWVLHTKYSSYVTVGAFDDPGDPRIRFFQEELPKLNTGPRALNPAIQLVAHPPVMPVPR